MLHNHLKTIFFLGVLITSTNIYAENNDTDHHTPRRIITIAPNAAEIICSLGACDSIVGVSEYCVYPAELKKRTKIGGFINPDLERIVALQPDLIVLRGQNDSIEKLCREMNIAIYQDHTNVLHAAVAKAGYGDGGCGAFRLTRFPEDESIA